MPPMPRQQAVVLQQTEKVSVDVIERDAQYFADIGMASSTHSLGPTQSRDEIYHLIFSFIADLRLISEIDRNQKDQDKI